MQRNVQCVLASVWLAACGGEPSSGDQHADAAIDDGATPAADARSAQPDTMAAPDVRAAAAPDGTSSVVDAGTEQMVAESGVDAAVVGSEGCRTGSGLAEGEHTFELEERERRYVLHLPNGYDGTRPWPVVLALHPNGGNLGYWDATSGERNIRGAVQDDAVLVIAEAIGGNWRDYDLPADMWPALVEAELLYFDTVLGEIRNELCIDEDEVFSMGFSGGGSFSGVLGCRREIIRAIAVGGSVLYFDEADCVSTPAAWITIGTEELNSGREAFRDFFREAAGCAASGTDTEPPTCIAYDGCREATPVHYCQHAGGHEWPAYGTEAAWSFFQRFID